MASAESGKSRQPVNHRTTVRLFAGELSKKALELKEQAESSPPVQLKDIRVAQPASLFGKQAANTGTAAVPPPETPEGDISLVDVATVDAPAPPAASELDSMELVSVALPAAAPPAATTTPQAETPMSPQPPPTPTLKIPHDFSDDEEKKEEPAAAAATPTKPKKSAQLSDDEEPQEDAAEEKKKEVQKKRKLKKLASAFIDMEAEGSNEGKDGELSDDEPNSEDKAFIAPEGRVDDEEEEEEEEEVDAGKKKASRKPHYALDPFGDRQKEMDKEEKTRRLAALYAKGVNPAARQKILRKEIGIKGAGVDKTYEDAKEGEEDDPMAAEREQALLEKETRKALGDEDSEEISEGERVRREEREEAAATQGDGKRGALLSDSSSSSSESDGEEKEAEEDADGLDVAISLEAQETSTTPAAPPSPSPQVAKGIPTTLSIPELPSPAPRTASPARAVAAAKPVAAASKGKAPPSPSKLPVGMVDRQAIVSQETPKVVRLLVEGHAPGNKLHSRLVESFVAGSYLAIASGVTDTRAHSKAGMEAIENIGKIMAPVDAPAAEMSNKLVQDLDLMNLESRREIFRVLLTIGIGRSHNVRLVEGLKAAKNCHCALTGQPIAQGAPMHVLLVLVTGLRVAKNPNRILRVPIAPHIKLPNNIARAAAAATRAPPAPRVEQEDAMDLSSPAPTPRPVTSSLPVPVAPRILKGHEEKKKKKNKAEDAMDLDDDMQPTFAREEAEEEEEQDGGGGVYIPPGDEEEEEEEKEIKEPDNLLDCIRTGFNGIVVKNPQGFAHLSKLIAGYINTNRALVEWKPVNASAPVSCFDSATDMPKFTNWILFTTRGFIEGLFVVRRVKEAVKAGELVRCGKTSPLYVEKDHAEHASLVGEAGKEFNVVFLLRLFEGITALASTETPKGFPNAGLIMAETNVGNDAPAVQKCYVKIGADGKPMPGNPPDIARSRFVPRLLCQLLVAKPMLYGEGK